jgi:hypothetical protein
VAAVLVGWSLNSGSTWIATQVVSVLAGVGWGLDSDNYSGHRILEIMRHLSG